MDLKAPIFFEDNYRLLVEKSINIPVQADKSDDLNLLTILSCHYGFVHCCYFISIFVVKSLKELFLFKYSLLLEVP